MPNRLLLPLLLAASAVFAGGTFAHEDNKPIASVKRQHDKKEVLATTFDVLRPKNDAESVKFAPKRQHDKKEVLATTFDVLRPKGDAESVRFALRVVNNTTKMVEINFPDGQTHDFVVNDSTGKEVWRWSEGRMFTSAMRSKTLKGKDETVFEESWETTGHHGSFTAIATLRSQNFPIETSVQFVLP